MIRWNDTMDATLRHERVTLGKTWTQVGEEVGVCAEMAVARAKVLGIDTRRINSGRHTGEEVAAGKRKVRNVTTARAESVPVSKSETIKRRILRGMDPALAKSLPLQKGRGAGRKRFERTPEKETALRAARDEGKGWHDIGTLLGVSRAVAIQWAKEMGIETKEVRYQVRDGIIKALT